MHYPILYNYMVGGIQNKIYGAVCSLCKTEHIATAVSDKWLELVGKDLCSVSTTLPLLVNILILIYFTKKSVNISEQKNKIIITVIRLVVYEICNKMQFCYYFK